MTLRRALTVASLLVLGAAFVALATSDAWARGGGGDNFGGGGGGGSGGGGGGDGDGIGFLIYILIRLCIEYPAVGIPLTILIAVGFLLAGRRGAKTAQGAYNRSVVTRGTAARASNAAARTVEAVRARDPGFDAGRFQDRVRDAFQAVQTGWCAHDLTALRPFCSDGVVERFELQLAEQKALGYRDRMDQISIRWIAPIEHRVDGAVETLIVEIAASSSDSRVSLADGKYVSGAQQVLPFVERWSFVRRAGAQTKPGARGLMEGHCPNCAAPVVETSWAKCGSCGALLRSGLHDWVLVEITQEGEQTAAHGPGVAGLGALRARDPDLSPQVVEDRASVLFWRWMAALRSGDGAPLRGHAADEAIASVVASAAPAPDASRSWPGECGVGSVTTRGFVGDADRDFALILVRWSGTRFRQAPGRAPERVATTGIRGTLLVLERPRGATSRLDEGFSSAHCAGCGAPESKLGAAACEHCGAPPAGWERRWRLAQVVALGSAEALRWDARLGGVTRSGAAAAGGIGAGVTSVASAIAASAAPLPPLRREVVHWLAAVAASEDRVSPRERKAMLRIARKAGVPESEAEFVVDAPAAADLPKPADVAEARLWFQRAAEVALSDGVLSGPEEKVLARLAGSFSLGEPEIGRAVRDAQAAVLAEASRELREAKSRAR